MSGPDGFYRVTALPVGTYSLTVEAPQFATLLAEPDSGEREPGGARRRAAVASGRVAESVTVAARVQLVDTSSNALGARRHAAARSSICR